MSAARPDLEPGFWPEYKEPKSAVASIVQRPLYQITPEAVISAYIHDARAGRRVRGVTDEQIRAACNDGRTPEERNRRQRELSAERLKEQP